MIRIVLDTNVLLSGVLRKHGPPQRVVDAVLEGTVTLVLSNAALAEYRDVLYRPKFLAQHRASKVDLEDLFSRLVRISRSVRPEISFAGATVDPDDDIFLEAAVAGDAHYIVSGDRHLLDLGSHEGIPIVTPAAFVLMLETRG